MSAITQPRSTGITAQAASAEHAGDQRREQEHALVGGRRDRRLLEARNFSMSAKDWNRPHGPTTLGPRRICTAAQILRIGEQDVGDRDEQDHQQQHDCAAMTISGQRCSRRNSAIALLAATSAFAARQLVHSAMMADARGPDW
jgi:hypothetical protein